MRATDLARLCALAAIWGASFVFIRAIAPVLGPVWTATGRVLIGGVALVAWFALTGFDARVRRAWPQYLVIGIVNCALPFVLFGYAALSLPASYMVILNSAAPLFAALCAAVWLDERLTFIRLAGLVAGSAGVALVSGAGPLVPDAGTMLAVAASLAAALCYALAGIYIKRRAHAIPPMAIAGWSQGFAGIVLAPAAVVTTPLEPVTVWTLANLVALGLVCSAFAYLLYYRLIADIGPTRALTVTFLMPAFGMVWGVALLGETVTLTMLAGALLIVVGAFAVVRPTESEPARGPRPARRSTG